MLVVTFSYFGLSVQSPLKEFPPWRFSCFNALQPVIYTIYLRRVVKLTLQTDQGQTSAELQMQIRNLESPLEHQLIHYEGNKHQHHQTNE